MAPGFVQDYVAAHEVAHLAHMNHSDAFWRQVAQLTDHTDTAVAWLHREGPRLMRIG
jgi:predicted metal-dependent hydrolase